MSFMTDSGLRSVVEFTGALRLRYSLAYATLSDFDSEYDEFVENYAMVLAICC